MKISPQHVHWFRLRRSGLVQPFSSPEETARHLIGVQAQLLAAADLAFWNRTANCTSDGLMKARLKRRSIVRLWGQRDTLHIYHAQDWPLLHAAFEHRQPASQKRLERAGVLSELRPLVRRTAKRLSQGKPLTYKDIKSKKLTESFMARPMSEGQARSATAYVTFMQLVREGIACHGPETGSASSFVHRERWLPGLDWSPPNSETALAELARRYLTTYGPAEAGDLAFWFGTSVKNAKNWIESAGRRCRTVEVGDRTLWCCPSDLDDLAAKPPPASRWPIRLLYRFDPLLLATKDKSWLIDKENYKKVWRPSAHVEAVLLVGGRIAGTWRYDRKADGLHVRVSPFSRPSRTVSRAAEKQSAAIADFLGLPLADFKTTTSKG